MAATHSRRASLPPNGSYDAPQTRSVGNGPSRSLSSRARQVDTQAEGPMMEDAGPIPPFAPPAPPAPEAPRAPSFPYRKGGVPHYANPQYRNITRSFSARSRDRAPEATFTPGAVEYDDAYGVPNEQIQTQWHDSQRASQPNPFPINAPRQLVDLTPVDRTVDLRKPTEPARPALGSQASPLSRSSTVRSVQGEARGLPVDRSPLQKLETRLVGMSKEEKRARMVEAEQKLREQIARRQSQSTGSTTRAGSLKTENRNTEISEELEENRTNMTRNIGQVNEELPRRSATVDSRSNRYNQGYQYARRQSAIDRESAPEQVQYAAVQSARKPQYSSVQDGQRRRDSAQLPQQNQRHSRSLSVGGPGNGEPSLSEDLPKQGPSTSNINNIASKNPGVSRSGSTKAYKLLGLENNQQPRKSYAGQQAEATTINTRRLAVTEEDLLDHETGIAPTHFAGTALNRTVENDQHELNEDIESTPTLKKSKRHTVSFDVPPPTPPPLYEWQQAPVARLRLTDRDFERVDLDRGKAWWEEGNSSKRRRSRALPSDYRKSTPKANERNRFDPLLFLKCGPLLRYLGIKRTTIDGPEGPIEQEVWRGSIMIVTTDSLSSLETPPTLRIFSQPMDLLPPPPRQIGDEHGGNLAPEYVDPTAGLTKCGRDGRTLYVKPVDHLEEELDLSQVESEDGLFESSASPIDYGSNGVGKPVPSNRLHSDDGEKSGLYEEIKGFRLYSDPARDVTFWRFNVEVELSEKQERIAYRINEGPAIGFWVPAKAQPMNIMFHSCNGFSLSVDRDKFSGPDPLWRDVLNEHQTRPFHIMIGGGDQIYCDKVIEEADLFEEWTRIKNPHHKHNAPFSAALKAELETFYLNHYASWFSHGLFSLANGQIPMVNIWDDHDIIDGFGSYSDHFMRSPVFSGLGNIAFKYYMLFQHQSVPEETEADEPSWILGPNPGPYIKERSRSVFMSFGKGVSFLGLDCRTERMRDEIVSEQTYDHIWDRCHREIVKGETNHLIVLLGVPIAYPRLVWLENILTSRVLDPVKALSRAGMFSGLVNKFDGSVEILDDLDDHWTAKNHKNERTWLIEDLQDLAAEKSIRVTILSGDVHLAAIGQFYSNSKLDLPKDKDYRYMPNIISSAIVNAPPPEIMADVLNRRNKIHHMDTNTDEEMIPIFTHDVDGKNRNNKRLLPRRNWCSIRQNNPPPTPPESPELPAEQLQPGKLKRTLSLGARGDSQNSRGGLFRRLSLRGPPPTKEFNLEGGQQRRFSTDATNRLPPEESDGHLPSNEPRPGVFHRRPTNLSTKASKKANLEGADGAGDFINLEGGLDITLNLEVNPKDPAGITTPYKLLVPALWYDGGYDPEPRRIVKGWKKWLGRGRQKQQQQQHLDHPHADNDNGAYDDDDYSESDNSNDVTPPAYPPQLAPGPPEFTRQGDNEPDSPPKRKKWLGIV
ncbi:hypothetical protein BGW36DRAFT_427716 [Talaromyces proteolyticus]|uniref:PhoD-like phosphatase domain-containing protein n=1 Tax=Talaromyces proteolyticus TaxID=1131652 RepID=A0AAD4KWU1_9EURO|nr:uncharacterized protein BGW36DRAFT_427716 [Talaromyces proteolyticus]KAH8697764.1 hypothetical protein BGW36DRAFT_427716 [Talaromyces proteolyticus]